MSRNSQDEGSRLARLIEAIQPPPPLKYEIERFPTTEAIWAFLDKLFGDDKELIRILMNEIKTMEPLKVKDTKSIRNFVATVRGFILRMEDVGAGEEVKSRYVFADILTKLTAEDQKAYRRSWQVANNGLLKWTMLTMPPPPGCGIGGPQLHDLGYCPAFKKMKVKERWVVVIQSKRCKKCLKTGCSVHKRHVISTTAKGHTIIYCIKSQNLMTKKSGSQCSTIETTWTGKQASW